MIISTGREDKWAGSDIVLRWREENNGVWVRHQEVVTDFRPYLFVNPDNFHQKDEKSNQFPRKLRSHQVKSAIREKYRDAVIYEKGYEDASGNALWKVELESPAFIRGFQRKFWPTYEADVPYEDRYLVDRVDEIKKFPMRKFFFDLESLQYQQGEQPEQCLRPNDPRDRQAICVIGGYDNFTDTYFQWMWNDDTDKDMKVVNYEGRDVILYTFTDEQTMLQHFVDFLDEIDPDVMLAWGLGFYDMPTLYRRLESVGIGAKSLSPKMLGKNRFVDRPYFKGTQYRPEYQPIRGRIVISLDVLFERVYYDSKSANLPSKKLDVVGQKLFKKGKTDFRPNFYDLEQITCDLGMFYNFRDVELMVEIEESYNLIEGQQNLQALAKCQFSSTLRGSRYARVYFMRKASFKQKTGWENEHEEDEDLKGATILDPEELGTIGLHKNTVILDFAGLYPSMMVAYNTSFETKVPKGLEHEDDIIGDGCRFRRDPMGVLPACVIELDELRDEYKNLRAEAAKTHGKTSDEYRKWDDAQKTVKRLRATFYGLMALSGYAWGDIDIARTITYGGRTALKTIIDKAESLGFKTIYGHTDSIFVALGDDLTPEECAQKSEELGVILTEDIQKILKSDAVVVEAELIMDRFYLPRRNKYAGRIIWQPGSGESPFDISNEPVDDRIKIQGLEAKHTNTAIIGKKAQIESMKLIWDDEPPEVVLDYVKSYIAKIKAREVPIEEMTTGARLNFWLPTRYAGHALYGKGGTNDTAYPDAKDDTDKCYKTMQGAQRGAAWHNVVLANDEFPKFDRGDSFRYTFVKDGPTWIPTGGYVGFHDTSQIEEYELDIDMIVEKNVINKLDHIMYGIGLSNDMLRDEEVEQLSLEDFM